MPQSPSMKPRSGHGKVPSEADDQPTEALEIDETLEGEDEFDPTGVAGFCFAMMALIVLIRLVEDILRHYIQGSG